MFIVVDRRTHPLLYSNVSHGVNKWDQIYQWKYAFFNINFPIFQVIPSVRRRETSLFNFAKL